ncbi:M48 family metallopeptidase [Tenacibaculum larymnensis]|uniref:M48 family metallopeptidase n=1 Tax=Tenacibaculum larymnensis TaxID=2878201 RepID=A0A9X4ENV8_9FLAO|nr:M48 family metallopeptidase [Tenacibaculum larymnensis]MDE1206594.1 M48 family metallopeptidase [Tenacibaculum larymnensis]
MKKIIALTFLAAFLVECSTVPITGRKRLNFVNDAQILPASFAQYKGFLEENKLSTNTAKTNEIRRVGKNISTAVDRFMRANGMKAEADAYEWEFNLVEDKTVNAWCLPGGKVVFYTGILPICANEDGIAAVMGHEVAHAFAKHGQERMSTGQLQQLGGVALALGTQNSENAEMWNMAYGLGTQVGVMLPFSRQHETEADKLGLVFMIMAGYKGEEAAEVWVRMSQRSGGGAPPEFMSTHPSNQTRIQTLRNFLPEAKKLAAKYNVPTSK